MRLEIQGISVVVPIEVTHSNFTRTLRLVTRVDDAYAEESKG